MAGSGGGLIQRDLRFQGVSRTDLGTNDGAAAD